MLTKDIELANKIFNDIPQLNGNNDTELRQENKLEVLYYGTFINQLWT